MSFGDGSKNNKVSEDLLAGSTRDDTQTSSYDLFISRLTASPWGSQPWAPLALVKDRVLTRPTQSSCPAPARRLPTPPASTQSSRHDHDAHHFSIDRQGQDPTIAFIQSYSTEPCSIEPDPTGNYPYLLAGIGYQSHEWPPSSQSDRFNVPSADSLSPSRQSSEPLSPRNLPSSISPCSQMSLISADSGYVSGRVHKTTGRVRKRMRYPIKQQSCAKTPGTQASSPKNSVAEDTPSHSALSERGCSVVSEEWLLSGLVVEEEVSEANTTESIGPSTTEEDAEDSDKALDAEVSPSRSRSPSPWQTANSPDSEQALVHSLWWIANGTRSEILQDQTNTTGTPVCSGSDSPAVKLFERISTHAQGTSGSERPPPTQTEPSTSASASNSGGSGGSQAPKLARDSQNSRKDSDEGDDEGPSRKRFKPAGSEMPLLRPRFACPYQKYDPLGSPFCCKPGNNNPEGGADTFPRIKSHIFRNHDPFIRCPNCWKSCKTEEEAQQHKDVAKCIQRASPAKYWMTREQRDEIRGRKFMASSGADNWFCLFGILMPYVAEEEYRKLSPYYVAVSAGPLTPSPSITGSAYRRVSTGSQPSVLDTGPPLMPTPQLSQSTQSFSASHTFTNPFQSQQEPSPNPNFSFTSYPPAFDAEGDLNSRILNWDLPESSQQNSSHLRPPTSFLSVSTPMSESLLTPPAYNVASSRSPFHNEPAGQASPHQLLRQDIERLRAKNSSLEDENDAYRKQQAEYDAQLSSLRSQLRPLENAVQDILYLPSVLDSEGVVNQLFTILNGLDKMRKTLISAQPRP